MDFFRRGVCYAILMGIVTLLGCAQPTDSERSRAILSHRNLGLAHLEENHLEAARAEFAQLIEALPGDPGDCFTGALAVALAEGRDLAAALRFANDAASLAVMRMGASASFPTRAAVDQL